MNDIQNPRAYEAGKQARIKRNANSRRRAELERAVEGDSAEFKAWLFGNLPAELDALRIAAQADFDAYDDAPPADGSYEAYSTAHETWRKRVGFLPDALREARDNWGGLSEKQLAWARDAFAKNIARAEGRDAAQNARNAAEAERKASAPAWVAGRETVSGTIQFARGESATFGYRESFTIKAIVLLDDGRKCWTSIPQKMWPGDGTGGASLKGQRITFAATFTPSDDDATMAFAKRPTIKETK